MNSSFKYILYIFTFTLTIFFCSCSSKNEKDVTIESGTLVRLAQPQKMNLTEHIMLNATTVFMKKEVVRATFQGFIEKLYKNIGDQISKGDILFEIRTKESVANGNLQLPFGDKIFKGVIQFKANTNGVLTQLDHNVGDFISDGEQIAVIANPSSLRINLSVPYQYTDKITFNTQCEIILPNNKVVNALIQKIIPTVDQNTQAQTYILELKKQGNLPENLNVSVRVPVKTVRDAIVVPKSALMTNETLDQYWLMKLIDDNTVVRMDVQKGIENDSFVQIFKPELKMTDRIIIEGAFGLPDTAKVVIGK